MTSQSMTSSFSAILEDWTRLYDITPEVSPFLHPDAMKIAVKYFYPYYFTRKARPRFIVFKEDSIIRAIIPFLEYSSGKLQLFGDVNGFNESGFVYDSVELLPKIFSSLKSINRQIEFLKIDTRSPIASLISQEVRSTSNAEIHFGDSHADYIATLSKSVRQNIRTAYNRLKTDCLTADLKIFTILQDLPLSDVINLYCRRHSQRYGVHTGWFKNWFLKSQSFATRYYRFSSNALTTILHIDNKPAAFLSGLYSNNRLIVPRLSIDEHFHRYSPGVLLVVETIKYLQNHTNIRVLDLSQGDEAYKYQLGATEHFSYRFTL